MFSDMNAKKRGELEPSHADKTPCSVSISVIFALGCFIIIAAFVAVSTYSGIKFSQNVKGAVDDNLELALRGAIKAIQSPLEESERYLNRLRIKIENNPSTFAVDDEFPKSFVAGSGFYTDAMLAAYQRPEISSIFQLRRSTRYQHSPGSPVDNVAIANMPSVVLSRFANNSLTNVRLTSMKALATIPSVGLRTFPANLSGTPFINMAYDTVGTRWVVGVLSVPGLPISTRMSIYSQVNGSVSSWAVGVDHNMTIFQDLMKQATAPFSIGLTNPTKNVASGAHTSLYDLSTGVLMSTSVAINLFKSSLDLWPGGGSPNVDINTAYAHAITACPPAGTACIANPALLEVDGKLVGAFRLQQPSSGLDLLLVSSVPRKHFFGEADRALAVSIGVDVVCCVLIVAGCVAVLIAIGLALRRLQENMLLASMLQNHIVQHTSSRLTEIAKLSSVFDEMNQRLLIARSFVPEAVLLGEEDCEEEDEGAAIDNEDVESEESDRSIKTSSHVRSVGSNRSSVVQRSILRRAQDSSRESESAGTTSLFPSETPLHVGRLFTMNEKRVAVLSLNMVGFNALVAERGGQQSQRINDLSSKMLTVVVQAAQRERGVMDSFHGDHFILTFNASRAVASALSAAIRTANAVAQDIRRDPRLRGCRGVAAGAAIGKAFVGTMGIDGYRRFSIIGSAYRQAIALQAVSSQFIMKTSTQGSDHSGVSGCVIEESALREIGECGMYMQLIGRALPPIGARNQTARPVYAAHGHKSSNNNHSKRPSHTPDPAHDGTANEWLYELDAIHAGDPFAEPNAALEALMSGKTDTCNQMLTANDCNPAPTPQTPLLNRGGASGGSSQEDLSPLEMTSNVEMKVGWGPVEALYRQHIAQLTTTASPHQNVWDHISF